MLKLCLRSSTIQGQGGNSGALTDLQGFSSLYVTFEQSSSRGPWCGCKRAACYTFCGPPAVAVVAVQVFQAALFFGTRVCGLLMESRSRQHVKSDIVSHKPNKCKTGGQTPHRVARPPVSVTMLLLGSEAVSSSLLGTATVSYVLGSRPYEPPQTCVHIYIIHAYIYIYIYIYI